ncbi:unnamed protein product, partial [Tetraodon nigroviridis]
IVPTVTAISSTPDFQWMVQPTIITSVSPSLGSKQANEPRSPHQATPKEGGNKGKNAVKKGKAEQVGRSASPLTTRTAAGGARSHGCVSLHQPHNWAFLLPFQLSPEEEEKKRIRRERNKMAAAKCRNRRRELTDTLQAVSKHLRPLLVLCQGGC